MKQLIITLLQYFLLLLMFTSTATVYAKNDVQNNDAQAVVKAPIVSYDKTGNLLSIEANQVSLKFVLDRIAQHSGIEVMFDEAADVLFSINIQSEPLEDGLKHLLKGSNYMLRYGRDEQDSLLLIGVMVLPVGEQDRRRAQRTVAMGDEAYYRARQQLTQEKVQQVDFAMERWQVRFSELPDQVRQKLTKSVESRLLKSAKREQYRAEIKVKRKQDKAAEKVRRQKAREQLLQGMDTDQRTAFEQSNNDARERMRVMLQYQQ